MLHLDLVFLVLLFVQEIHLGLFVLVHHEHQDCHHDQQVQALLAPQVFLLDLVGLVLLFVLVVQLLLVGQFLLFLLDYLAHLVVQPHHALLFLHHVQVIQFHLGDLVHLWHQGIHPCRETLVDLHFQQAQ